MTKNLAARLEQRLSSELLMVVEGDAPKLASLLAESVGGEVLMHRRFGTAKFRCEDLSIDFATARAETYAHPGALPSVQPGSIGDDLRRRDFTINAMAVPLNEADFGNLLDPYDGEKDLGNKFIRILHEKSFIDDATRILRAIRYEKRFDFQLERTTESLLRRDLAMLNTLSGDRIRHELELILKEERPEKMLRRAGELGVLKEIHPSLEGNGWLEEKLQQARSGARPSSATLYFSLLLYHFSQDEGEQFIVRMKIPGAAARVIRDTLHLKENLQALAVAELTSGAIYRLLKEYSATSILANALASDSPLVCQRLDLYLDKLRYVKISLDGGDFWMVGTCKKWGYRLDLAWVRCYEHCMRQS
jgi:tRNA nucleotidyltransferase (CCA-adding enzyme)